MKIGVIKKIVKDDLGAGGQQLPGWLDPFLSVLNNFIDQVVSAIQGRLTFEDNLLCKKVSGLSLTHATPLTINPQREVTGRNRILGLIFTNTSGYLLDSYGYSVTQSGQMSVTACFATVVAGVSTAVSAGTVVKCDFIVLLG